MNSELESDRILQKLKQRVDSCQQNTQEQPSAKNIDLKYRENFAAFRSVITEANVICNAASDEIAKQLRNSDNPQSYRICSLGCGDSKVDKQILQTLTKEWPDVQFEYVGLDNNKAILEIAESTLKDNMKNVEATTENLNLEDDHALSKYVSEFDAVIAIHLMCYLKSKASLLPKFVALLKPSGVLFAIHCAIDDSLCRLTEVFPQDHEKGCYMLPKDDVVSCLAEMKGKREIHDYTSEDHTASFEKQKFYQNDETRDRVLDFIVHVPLQKYPRDIKELCLKYLDTVHEETSGMMIRMNSFIIWNK